MATIQIRVNDELRTQAQAVANSMGLDLPSAVRVFLTQMVRENKLPFTPQGDPFYSSQNQAVLCESLEELKQGKTIVKTIEELEAMGNG